MSAVPNLPSRLAFVDLETTGATATVDRITEVGVVAVDLPAPGSGQSPRVEAWSSLVNPGVPIPPFIQSLTGISDAMVADAPGFDHLASELASRLAGRLFVAHNARFDLGFLKNEFRRAGLPFNPQVLCTVKLSRRLFPGERRHGLDALIQRFGLTMTARHRALGDAEALWQFWQVLQSRFSQGELLAALRGVMAQPALPPHLDADILDAIPNTPGVYFFYGENDLPLYIGKSKHLRKRVLAHFSADHRHSREMSLSQQVRRIEWEETSGELGALLREAQLVKTRLPIHNRQLRRERELCSWRLTDRQGSLVPELVWARDLELGGRETVYGLFSSQKEAVRCLRQLAETHQLCLNLLGLEASAKSGQPCFAFQLGRCRGACCGRETPAFHSARLQMALQKLAVAAWPYPGPVGLREGEMIHVVDHWRYLGGARNEAEIEALLEGGRPAFERDSYLLLKRWVARLELVSLSGWMETNDRRQEAR